MMLLLVLGCVREVSRELELLPAAAVAPDPEPADAAAWRRWVLHGDPLGRHPRLPTTLPDPQYSRWRDVAAANPPAAAEWWFAERAASGTASVALLRGARLAAVETLGADPRGAEAWIVPLGDTQLQVDTPRAPFAWLSARPADAVPVAERAALLGWMDGPGIDVSAPAARLADPAWTRLATTPAGAMLLGRVGTAAPDPAAHSMVTLAGRLALAEAVSDRSAAAPLRTEALAALGLAEGDPAATRDLAAELLRRAFPALAAAAHVDEDAGLALVAHGALRLRGACDDLPCGGFDRMAELTAAARFGPGPAAEAAVWRTLAWDAAVDQLWAAWERPQVTRGMDRVTELVEAEHPGALDRSHLQRNAPEPGWILPITRALGAPEGTSKEALFRALYPHVAAVAHGAQAEAPAAKAALERVEKRARVSGR